MPKKPAKKARAAKPARRATPARPKKTAPPSRGRARPPKRVAKAARSTPPKPPSSPLAARLAAFSAKALAEEEEPVAVRSWSEAKQGSSGSKQFLPKTGQVRKAPPAEDEDEEPRDADEESADETPREAAQAPPPATAKPRLDPLTGPLAVPRDRELEFRVEKPGAKRAKKGKGERPEEFGLVELRQATASGGRHLTRVKRDNLQAKGASKIQPLTAPSEEAGKKRAAPERFEVARDARAAPRLPDLSDFGEVEIGQQTLSGSRKVARLDLKPGEAEEPKRKKAK